MAVIFNEIINVLKCQLINSRDGYIWIELIPINDIWYLFETNLIIPLKINKWHDERWTLNVKLAKSNQILRALNSNTEHSLFNIEQMTNLICFLHLMVQCCSFTFIVMGRKFYTDAMRPLFSALAWKTEKTQRN